MKLFSLPILSASARMLLILFALFPVACSQNSSESTEANGGDEIKPIDGKLTRFVTNDFFAAAYHRPDAFLSKKWLNKFPLSVLAPKGKFSFEAKQPLSRLNPKELLVLIGSQHTEKNGSKWSTPTFSVVGNADPFDLAKLLASLPKEDLSKDSPLTAESLSIGKQVVQRIPSGTFLPQRCLYGSMTFLDRNGEPRKAISVGDFDEYIGYFEGGNKSAVRFRFQGVTESLLKNGKLNLVMRPVVFRTQWLETPASGTLFLRNPKTGLQSLPLKIQPHSYEEKLFSFPRNLRLQTEENSKEGELFQDLVSDGELEVVVQCDQRSVYFGFGSSGLGLQLESHEYLFQDEQTWVIAQSKQQLEKMLRQQKSAAEEHAQSPLAKELGSTDSDFRLLAQFETEHQRTVMTQLFQAFTAFRSANLNTDRLSSIDVRVKSHEYISLECDLAFEDSESSLQAESAIQGETQKFKRFLNGVIREFETGVDPGGNLASLVGSGAVYRFPFPEKKWERSNSPMARSLSTVFDSVTLVRKGSSISIGLSSEAFAEDQNDDRLSAWLFFKAAQHMKLFDRFSEGEVCLNRMVEQLSSSVNVHLRRSFELAYNDAYEFASSKRRFDPVRTGLLELLESAQTDGPFQSELLWQAGAIISDRIGQSDDRVAFQQYFAQDQKLRQAIEKILPDVDLLDGSGRFSAWLCAEHLVLRSIESIELDSKHKREPQGINTYAFFMQPLQIKLGHARSLQKTGDFESARKAIQSAKTILKKLKTQNIFYNGEAVSLTELERLLFNETRPNASPSSFQELPLRIARSFEFYGHLCDIELTTEMQQARTKLWLAGRKAKEGKDEEAWDLFEEAFATFVKGLNQFPKSNPTWLWKELKTSRQEYLRLSESLDRATSQAYEEFESKTKPGANPQYSPYNQPFLENLLPDQAVQGGNLIPWKNIQQSNQATAPNTSSLPSGTNVLKGDGSIEFIRGENAWKSFLNPGSPSKSAPKTDRSKDPK